MELARYDLYTFPFYGVVVQAMIPLLLLMIASIRKRKENKKFWF
ncbi:hypothetical protein [Peribacillus muralis]